jgi:hypothetical protein
MAPAAKMAVNKMEKCHEIEIREEHQQRERGQQGGPHEHEKSKGQARCGKKITKQAHA